MRLENNNTKNFIIANSEIKTNRVNKNIKRGEVKMKTKETKHLFTRLPIFFICMGIGIFQIFSIAQAAPYIHQNCRVASFKRVSFSPSMYEIGYGIGNRSSQRKTQFSVTSRPIAISKVKIGGKRKKQLKLSTANRKSVQVLSYRKRRASSLKSFPQAPLLRGYFKKPQKHDDKLLESNEHNGWIFEEYLFKTIVYRKDGQGPKYVLW